MGSGWGPFALPSLACTRFGFGSARGLYFPSVLHGSEALGVWTPSRLRDAWGGPQRALGAPLPAGELVALELPRLPASVCRGN